jgi:small subunit ribosomal protein S19e
LEGAVLPTVYDVPADTLIDKLSEYIKENIYEVKPENWASFAKTSSIKERSPQNPDWWFIRCASLLRKIYIKGPIGIEHLRSEYGGRKDQGSKPEHSRKGSGSVIRKSLKQLEKAGLLECKEKKGRVVTSKGRQLLDRLSAEIKKEMEKKDPEYRKYS